MHISPKLKLLKQAYAQGFVPPGRSVVLAARVTPAIETIARDLAAKDVGARVGGGRSIPVTIGDAVRYNTIVTWNTGEASDLRRTGNRSHAEAQLCEALDGKTFDSIELEISHSPCTACIDMLNGLLQRRSRTPVAHKRVGNRIFIGGSRPTAPCIIRWAKLYDMPPQATTWPSLGYLQQAGWELMAPYAALPAFPDNGYTPAKVAPI